MLTRDKNNVELHGWESVTFETLKQMKKALRETQTLRARWL